MPLQHVDEAEARPPGPCANCGAEVPERYCTRCGQDRGLTPHVPLSELAGEALGEALSLDSRMGRTLLPFFLRPGFLTAEFLAGRRVRYSSPLRLYLLATVAFFLVASLGGKGHVRLSLPSASGAQVNVGWEGDRELPPGQQAEERRTLDEELVRLKQGNVADRLLADRLEQLSGLPPDEASRRLGQALAQQAPRVLFFLVPVMAGLLALLYRRSGFFLAEHLVFSLHAHALGFALLIPGALGAPWLAVAGVGATALHLLLAMRRVYRRPWPGTVLRFLALLALYLVALGLGMAGATLLALALL